MNDTTMNNILDNKLELIDKDLFFLCFNRRDN